MMSSTAHLVVLVLDVNDNPPIFERTQYSETISELARVGTSVLRVLGTLILCYLVLHDHLLNIP